MNDLQQQGIEAFQAGDRDRARQIFEQIVAAEPNNETAWYFLAASQTDLTIRRQYLERVLTINPNHARAREVLDRMNNVPGVADAPSSQPYSAAPPLGTPIRPLPGATGHIPGEASSGGFAMPGTIPGAPARVGFAELFRDGFAQFMIGVGALQNRIADYDGEVAQATWWKFWLLVGFGAVVTTLLGFISGILIQVRLPSFNVLAIIISLVLGVPLTLAITYAGVALSHWWTKRQGSTVPQYMHAYATVIPYIPAQIIGGVLVLVLSLIGLGGIASLLSFILTIYALYTVYQGYQRLHRFSDGMTSVIAIVMFFVGSIIAGLLLGIVLGIFGAAAVLPLALAS